MLRLARFAALGQALFAFVACAAPTTPPTPQASSAPSAASVGAAGPEAADAAVRAPGLAAAAGPMFTIATDRALMQKLEASGASFAALLEGEPTPLANAALASKPRYASIIDVLADDVRAAQAADPAAGVGMAKSHRLLDLRVLRSPRARFDLIAASLRLDRAHVRRGTCGEARFIYRLSYETTQGKVDIASRLPATIALTYWLADGASDCRDAAARASIPAAGVTADWLLGDAGPFGGIAKLRSRFKAAETNVQIVRWPSTTRPDMAGHAEYAMHVLEPKTPGAAELAPSPLENTPDPSVTRDPAKRAELTKWVRENLDAIEAGTALLPESLLAKKSVSVSPRGLARVANRPFRQILDPAKLDDLAPALKGRTFIGSPEALVRRLDQLSCAGCHQTRSVAGFHLLGEDPVAGANSIAVPLSPHALSEVQRRAALLSRVASGGPMPAHPPAERAPHDKGGYGARCGLGDPGFAAWTCDEGLTCERGDRTKGESALVGTCLPKKAGVGDPCEHAVVSREPNPSRDRATIERSACGAGAVCGTNTVGFPGGMCSTSCAAAGPDGVCGGIPILTDFNACLGRNEPFERCIAANTRPAGIRGCDAKNPCREDYICAGSPAVNKGEGRGACMPPYFLFQLRVDGHPAI